MNRLLLSLFDGPLIGADGFCRSNLDFPAWDYSHESADRYLDWSQSIYRDATERLTTDLLAG